MRIWGRVLRVLRPLSAPMVSTFWYRGQGHGGYRVPRGWRSCPEALELREVQKTEILRTRGLA